MNNLIGDPILFWIGILIALIVVLSIVIWWQKHRKKVLRPRLIVFFNNKNKCMSTVNAVNFTTNAPDQGVVSVVDTANGNAPLSGTLTNLTAISSDPTQDTGAIDTTKPNTVDVAPVSNQGASMIVVKGDFTSQGNPGITDGTVFPGLVVQVAATNNIPTTPPPPPTPVPGIQVTFP